MRKRTLMGFAKRWGVSVSAVDSVWQVYLLTGTYRETGKIARSLGTEVGQRQIRYFCRRMRLDFRIEYEKLGRPKNYRRLLSNYA